MIIECSTISFESSIIWLRSPHLYDYIRESVLLCNFRVRFPVKSMDPAKNTDGGKLAHLVAYATLNPQCKSSEARMFFRRYWWVKSYDRFVGSDPGRGYYRSGAPCEAVWPLSVIAGLPSEQWDDEEIMLAL